MFKVKTDDVFQKMEINLSNEEIFLNPDLIQYTKGNISFIRAENKRKILAQYYKHGASSLIPKVQGSGTVFMKPILGNFTVIDLQKKENHGLICNSLSFVAAESQSNLSPKFNLTFDTLFSNLPIRVYQMSNQGSIVLYSSGPLEKIQLNNEKFSIYTGEIICYSDTLKMFKTVLNDGLLGLTKRDKNITHLFGTGTVYYLKQQNINHMLANFALRKNLK